MAFHLFLVNSFVEVLTIIPFVVFHLSFYIHSTAWFHCDLVFFFLFARTRVVCFDFHSFFFVVAKTAILYAVSFSILHSIIFNKRRDTFVGRSNGIPFILVAHFPGTFLWLFNMNGISFNLLSMVSLSSYSENSICYADEYWRSRDACVFFANM